MFRKIFIAATAIAICATPVAAQEQAYDDIVVTASRYVDAYERFTIPHVALVRRADFAVQELTISSDTRDAGQRRQELQQALQSLSRFADRDARVSVALIEEDEDESGPARVVRFTVEKALDSLLPGSRPDTSYVTISVRTRVSAEDTLDAVNERVAAFVRAIPRPGRVEVSRGEMQLSLTDPQQYRPQLIANIAADANAATAALGAGYGAQLDGLENPIAWRRAGDLDLRLFISYRMTIVPRDRN
ncbi:MAG: hypothetical protein AB7O98_08220 [Hyphomonadaceae bacterium]